MARKKKPMLVKVDRVGPLIDVWWNKEHAQFTFDELCRHNVPIPDELVEPVTWRVCEELYFKLGTHSARYYLCSIKEPTVEEPFNLVKLRDPDEPYGQWMGALVDEIKEMPTGEKLYFAARM
jgi:hypothetical protein